MLKVKLNQFSPREELRLLLQIEYSAPTTRLSAASREDASSSLSVALRLSFFIARQSLPLANIKSGSI